MKNKKDISSKILEGKDKLDKEEQSFVTTSIFDRKRFAYTCRDVMYHLS